VYGVTVVSGGEPSPVFESVKAAFDVVSLFVERGVVSDWLLALGGDHCVGIHLLDVCTQLIGIIGVISQYGFGLVPLE